MSQLLYSTIENLSVGGRRAGYAIYKTDSGIKVVYDTLYGDTPKPTRYYSDGQHPEIPADWAAVVNEGGTTEYDLFIQKLQDFTPYRVVTR